MTFRGDLKEICLFDVFQNIANNQLTGTLAINSERVQRWIHFEAGKIRFASLGAGIGLPMRGFLVRRGYVEQRALEKAISDNRRGRPALRNILEKEGLLGAEQFTEACRDRLIELIYETFEVKEATFEFQEGDPSEKVFDRDQRALDLRLDPMPLLVESARRDDEWKRIRMVVASDRDLFQAAGEEPQEEDLLLVWEALDGATDVDRLGAVLGLGRFEVCDAISRLASQGQARAVGSSEISTQAEAALAAGDHARARSLLEQALATERNNRKLRKLLAELYEALGDNKHASETWALLGYQATLAGQDQEALAAYQRGIAQDPHDLGLREKACELQERVGSGPELANTGLDLAERYAASGLLDKAIVVLDRIMRRPDLADQPELLARCAGLECDAGRSDAAQARLLHAAQVAHRLGDRKRAEKVLVFASQLLPEAAPIRSLLDEVRTNRRALRRIRLRRVGRIAAVTGAAVACTFLAYDEVALRRDLQGLLRDAPVAVGRGTTIEPLGAALATYVAHPFTPSRRLLHDLADSLAEAEIEAVRELVLRDDYVTALARLDGLKAVVAGGLLPQRITDLEKELAQRRHVHESLGGWLKVPVTRPPSDAAFAFGNADVPQVLAIYPRLGEVGQTRVRWRLVELGSALALPLFTRRYLAGHDNENTVPRPVALYDHIGALAARARDERWRAQPGVRTAFLSAYETVVEGWLSKRTQSQEYRSRQLMSHFIALPPILPTDPEGFWRLVEPAR